MKKWFIPVLVALIVFMALSVFFHIQHSDVTGFFLGSAIVMFFDISALALAEISVSPQAVHLPRVNLRIGPISSEAGSDSHVSSRSYNIIFVLLTLFGVFMFVRAILKVYYPDISASFEGTLDKIFALLSAR